MVFGRKKEERQPTQREMIEAEQDSRFELSEGLPQGPPVDMIAFDFQVLDDEKILALFDPDPKNKELYCPFLRGIMPLLSRVMFVTNISKGQAELLKDAIDFELTRLKYRCNEQWQKDLVRSLKIYLFTRINDSVNGWKLNTLTERRRIIRLRHEHEQGKRWYQR